MSLIPMYYRNAHAAIILYDVSRLESFEKAKFWVEELDRMLNYQIIILLIGNKIDLEKEVQTNVRFG